MFFTCFGLLFCIILSNCEMFTKPDSNNELYPKMRINFNDQITTKTNKPLMDYISYFTRDQMKDVKSNEIKDDPQEEMDESLIDTNKIQKDLIAHNQETKVTTKSNTNKKNDISDLKSRKEEKLKNIELRSLNDYNHDLEHYMPDHTESHREHPRKCKCMNTNPNPSCKHKCSGDSEDEVVTKPLVRNHISTECSRRPMVPSQFYPMVYYPPEFFYVQGCKDCTPVTAETYYEETDYGDSDDDGYTTSGTTVSENTDNTNIVNVDVCLHGKEEGMSHNNLIKTINCILEKHKLGVNVNKCYCSAASSSSEVAVNHYLIYSLLYFSLSYKFFKSPSIEFCTL